MHQWRFLNELNILRFSVVLELFFGISGVLIAMHSGSQAILLDGSYSLLCTLTMMANVRVSILVRQPPSAKNPYGHPTLEPLMLLFEGILLLGLCLTIIAVSVYQLSRGGYIPELNLPLAYEMISTIIGAATTTAFFLIHRSTPSPLIYFEFQEWLVDTVVSAAATSAFAIAYFLGIHHPVTPYIDSTLTLVLVLFLTRLPLKTLFKNFKQLLLQDYASPTLVAQTKDAIAERLHVINKKHINIHMIWLGRWLWVTIELTIHAPNLPAGDELQAIRAITESTVRSACQYYRIQLNLIFPEK